MILSHIIYVTTYFFDELTVHEYMMNRFFSIVAHMTDISQLPPSFFFKLSTVSAFLIINKMKIDTLGDAFIVQRFDNEVSMAG
jgi:hypothetical protein